MSEPSVTIRAFHYTPGSNLPARRVVIHTTSPPKVPYPVASAAGTARGTANYFTQSTAGGSAHYVADVSFTEHTLPESVIAWHAPPNEYSIGIEICGQPFYTREQWKSPQVWPALVKAAQITKDVCERRGIPKVKLSVNDLKAGKHGVCGHVDVSNAFKETDHTDPGTAFPWDLFMALVGSSPTPIPQEVKPMFDPPYILEPIIASRKCNTGGFWLLAKSGAVYAFEGAPHVGGANGKPYFVGHSAARFARDEEFSNDEKATGKIYVILDTSGSHYAYPE